MSTNPTGNLVKWWPSIADEPTPAETALQIRLLYNAINDHDQAITLLDEKAQTAVSTVQRVIESSSSTPPSPPVQFPFPYLGTVNDQRGNAAYTTELSDNGAKIAVGDALPITITLNAEVTAPWFAVIDNDSSSSATLIPSSGSIIGESSIPGGGFGTVFFDGANFFCGATDAGGGGGGASRGALNSNSNGWWWVWSDGVIEQFGQVTILSTGTEEATGLVTFPTPFTTQVFEFHAYVVGLPRSSSTRTASVQSSTVGLSTSGLNLQCNVPTGGGGATFDQNVVVNWRAIGV